MADDEDDYFTSLLKQHHAKRRAPPAEPQFPRVGPIYGPLRVIMQNPPTRMPRNSRFDDRKVLLERIATLEAENSWLRKQLASNVVIT
jgi:hypothetical protein